MKVVDRPVMVDNLVEGLEMDVEWVDIPDPAAGITRRHPHGDGVVSPRGSLLICEDRLSSPTSAQNVAGLTREGEFFRFCQINPNLSGHFGGHNLARTALHSEWAGATFSEDGEWLFINIFNPGATLAITGPWKDGYF
jgi:secreted PhoX family phosphatase